MNLTHRSGEPTRRSKVSVLNWPSNVQVFQVSDTLLGEIPVLFDKIVFHSAGAGGFESFDPIDAALAQGDLRMLGALHVHVLQMHREEPAGVLFKVIGRNQPGANRGHLELEFDQFGIEQVEQQVVSAFASTMEISNPSLWSPCCMPALAATSAMRLYSSAAFLTWSNVG